MNGKSLFNQRLTGCIAIAMLVAAGPALAQPASERPNMPVQMAQSSSLSGNWRLVIMGEPTSPGVVPQATELTAEFAGDRITGSGGCNRFMGGHEAQGGQLSIGPLASTFMACEEPVMSQEMKYLAALQGAQRYEVNDQGLTIFYQTEQESGVLRFTAQNVRGLW